MAAITTEPKKQPGRLGRMWKNASIIFESRVATVGLFMVMFWLVMGLISLVWTPHNPNASDFLQNQSPSATNWLGTDALGRDVFSRVMAGTQVILLKTRLPSVFDFGNFDLNLGSMSFSIPLKSPRVIPGGVAIWGVLGSLSLGCVLGLNAGYRGGWWDQVISQIMDALIAFPRIVLYLVVIAALGTGDVVMVLAISITGAPGIARLARSLALDIKTRDYIRAAETRGESTRYIMFKEILPNALGPLLVDSMLRVGYAIFTIGTLGFLGVGLPPPEPDWGTMIADARKFMRSTLYPIIAPAFAISTLVIGLNLFADGLREEITRFQK